MQNDENQNKFDAENWKEEKIVNRFILKSYVDSSMQAWNDLMTSANELQSATLLMWEAFYLKKTRNPFKTQS